MYDYISPTIHIKGFPHREYDSLSGRLHYMFECNEDIQKFCEIDLLKASSINDIERMYSFSYIYVSIGEISATYRISTKEFYQKVKKIMLELYGEIDTNYEIEISNKIEALIAEEQVKISKLILELRGYWKQNNLFKTRTLNKLCEKLEIVLVNAKQFTFLFDKVLKQAVLNSDIEKIYATILYIENFILNMIKENKKALYILDKAATDLPDYEDENGYE